MERETFVYIAKLAEQAERYEEMLDSMKNVAKLDVELTVEERNLLSVGYMNVIGARRASWRILSSIEEQNEEENYHNVKKIKEYRQKVETELTEISNDIMTVIDEHLIPSSAVGESTVFYYMMKGNFYRYLAEVKAEVADLSLKAYETASKAAETDLAPTHPTRLGLALNLSLFYYEIMNSPERGCHLAKQAFDEAISELDTLSEESYKDSTSIMQLLSDNLTLWTSDIPKEGGMGAVWTCEHCLVDHLTYDKKLEHEELHLRENELKAAEEAARRNRIVSTSSLDKIKSNEAMQIRRKKEAMYEKVLVERKMESRRVPGKAAKRGGGRGRGGKR